MTRPKRRGSATIEMTLVGIPIMFTLISIFEMSRGMWMYQTLAYSVKVGVRYAIVHGSSCDSTENNNINSCTANIGGTFNGQCPPPPTSTTAPAVAVVIECAAVGLAPDDTLLTFTPAVAGTPCYLGSSSSTNVAGPLGSHPGCLALTSTQWPPSRSNQVAQPISIAIQTAFRSGIAMFWPGAKTIGPSAGTINLGATSTDDIQF